MVDVPLNPSELYKMSPCLFTQPLCLENNFIG